jgi:RimJ/RimL family protein N-acetyltransferase
MQPLPPKQPELTTERLLLRALRSDDAPMLSETANDPDIAGKLSSMPYPYTLDEATKFIHDVQCGYKEGEAIEFAIVGKATGDLMGMIAMDLNHRDNHATIGYWLGKTYWGRGYATEVLREILRFGFETLKLHRMAGHHFHNNPASGRVLQKAGMKQEGRRVEHFYKNGEYLDIVDYGILAREWQRV